MSVLRQIPDPSRVQDKLVREVLEAVVEQIQAWNGSRGVGSIDEQILTAGKLKELGVVGIDDTRVRDAEKLYSLEQERAKSFVKEVAGTISSIPTNAPIGSVVA